MTGVDAQVELNAPGREPAAAPRGEHRRLGDLGHAERVGVEAAQGVLGAGQGGELDVVDGYEHQGPSWAAGAVGTVVTAKTRRKGNGVVPSAVTGYASCSRSR